MWNGVEFIANTVNGFTFARRENKEWKVLRLFLIVDFHVIVLRGLIASRRIWSYSLII